MNHTINAPGQGNNVVFRINETDKFYLKVEMDRMFKLASNDTTNIVMLPSASKYVFINFEYQYIYIINNKERLNGLNGKKIKKDNENSNINHVYTIFKGTLMLIIEV